MAIVQGILAYLRQENALRQIASWLLLCAGAVVLLRGMVVSFADVNQGLTLLGAGLGLLFGASVDRFEFLKAFGIEARTRRLTEKLDHADRLLRHMQTISAHVCGGLIKQAAYSRYWQTSFDDRELTQFAEATRTQLADQGVDEREIKEALRPWAQSMLWSWVVRATKPWEQAIEEEVSRLQTELKAAIEAGERSDPRWAELPQTIKGLQELRSGVMMRLFQLPRDQLIDSVLPELLKAPASIVGEAVAAYKGALTEWQSELELLQRHCKLHDASRWLDYVANAGD